MKKILILCLSIVPMLNVVAQTNKLRRSESFFGLHFDFHANKNDTLIGKTLSEGMIDTLLELVKPDFIQIDCKGHPGYSSYPSKIINSTRVNNFVKNPIELFRKVTNRHNVSLYVHYSGIFDEVAVKQHPEWAVIDGNGKISTKNTSVHSDYVNQLMLPQLKEISDYGVDGVWVDGDCWALTNDYSQKALTKFKNESGVLTIRKSSKDADYLRMMNFTRSSFKTYLSHYTDEIHKYNPSFQIASNWAFSSFMPEPVNINVDFLSGDLSSSNGINSALFESRVLATQSRVYKKPWDLMSWSFNNSNGNHVAKSEININQEAAEIMAMGGGYQCYFQQNRDASIRPHQIKTMANIAKFARKRQPFVKNTTPIPQIALLYSLASFNKFSPFLYNNFIAESCKATLTALLDGQNAVEILSEHHLVGNMQKYPLIVIPEWAYLENSFLNELNDYVKNGGNLIVIGSEAIKNFQDELKIDLIGKANKSKFWINVNNRLGFVNDSIQRVKINNNNQILGNFYNVEDIRFPSGIAASVNNYGKGQIVGIYFNFGHSYRDCQSPELRDFLNSIVRRIFPKPIVELTGSKLVHLTVNRLQDKIAINLINSGGNSNSNISTYDEVAPLHNLNLKIRLEDKPKRIVIQPENIILPFVYTNNIVKVNILKLDIHSIVIIE